MKYPFFFFIILTGLTSFSKDSLIVNQYNENGDKIGLWEQRIDNQLCPAKSENYTYIVYNRYDNDGRSICEHSFKEWTKSDSLNEVHKLNHHTLKLRIAIPVKKVFYDYKY